MGAVVFYAQVSKNILAANLWSWHFYAFYFCFCFFLKNTRLHIRTQIPNFKLLVELIFWFSVIIYVGHKPRLGVNIVYIYTYTHPYAFLGHKHFLLSSIVNDWFISTLINIRDPFHKECYLLYWNKKKMFKNEHCLPRAHLGEIVSILGICFARMKQIMKN